MYSYIQYLPTASTVQVLDDIVKILTGTTDISLLSSSVINQSSSFISIANTVAGWEIHDDLRLSGTAPSNQKVVLKSPITDMAGVFKYILLDGSNTAFIPTTLYKANSVIKWLPYESWDEITHTGVMFHRKIDGSPTNISNDNATLEYQNVLFARFSNASRESASLTVTLSSSSKHLFGRMLIDGLTDAGISFITEYSRMMPVDTPSNGFKNLVYNSRPVHYNTHAEVTAANRAFINIPKVQMNMTTVSDISTVANTPLNTCYLVTPFSNGYCGGQQFQWRDARVFGVVNQTILNENKIPTNFLIPFSFVGGYSRIYGGISDQCGVLLSSNDAQQDDKIIYNGNTYRIWNPSFNHLASSIDSSSPPFNYGNLIFAVLEG